MDSEVTPPTTEPDQLLDRVLAGDATPAERAELEAWAAVSPERVAQVAALHALWGMMGTGRGDVVGARAALQERREVESRQRMRAGKERRPFRKQTLLGERSLGLRALRGQRAYRTMTTLAIALGFIVTFAILNRRASQTRTLQMRTYVTTVGQRATVTLTDGSRVLLGPGTTLSVVRNLTDANLDAYLSGDARFTVVHSHSRTFRVHVGHAIVRVLGTTFLARRYRSDRIAQVVVVDGRVSLAGVRGSNTIGSEHVLAPSSLGVVDDSGQVRLTPHIDPNDYAGWMTGQLVFRDAPARDVIVELGRAYGVNIHIADSTVGARVLTWTVSTTRQSLPDVLEALTDVLGVRAVQSGRDITLVPGAPPLPRVRDSLPPFTIERQHGR